ncbi:TetR/AcrR family transcriptional regulator C-terminal domain-containing protein [Nocardia sp. 2]|uniref:TetR/AcrR family transcriptional regulator C-terminal domain-containing protein n=1 Tax=Nocardia acididurans TaxID=2802282 RepID=A0ABS1M0Z5_9NOCA|nr:TetR/AcrR family transcriptional regulator [Nocardia acididurans]MBL1074337.1 TetR/AcrR family transcriptional regulator C-terminal domain-containing protein [Nocardia acididurans]
MHTPDRAPLPKTVELLWDRTGTGTRGPKRGLSLDQILDAATAIGDTEGYTALSMARVAKHLGFTTMSLYRYVDSKDTLVELLLDRVIGGPPELPADAGWRTALEAWAWGEYHAIRAHEWWLDIPMTSPPLGPNNMAWLETGMSAFAGIPIPEPVKLQLIVNVSLSVIGRMRFRRDTAKQSEEVDYQAILLQVVDPERFPAVHSAMAHRAFESEDIDWEKADFGFFLDRLLDGYEVFIARFSRE